MRDSNIELLRGALMFMIVCVHITGNSVLTSSSPVDYNSTTWLSANIIDSFFYCCVNTFVLISGYFGIKPFIKKFLNLEIPVIGYCFTLTVLFYFIGLTSSKFDIIQSAFPIITNRYWFLTQYAILFSISPFINTFVEGSERKVLKRTIIIGLIFVVLFPSFTCGKISFANIRGMDFVNFSLLYLIGRYISKYGLQFSLKKSLSYYLVSSSLCLILTVLLAYGLGINKGWQSPFYAYNNILVYIQSIACFFIFKNIKLQSKIINYLSPSFFYIYIIHDNPIVNDYLYTWLECSRYTGWGYLFYTLVIAIVIFIVCLTIDILLRRTIFSKLTEKVVCFVDSKIQKVLNR